MSIDLTSSIVTSFPLIPLVYSMIIMRFPCTATFRNIEHFEFLRDQHRGVALGFHDCGEYLFTSILLTIDGTLGICSIFLFYSLSCLCKVRIISWHLVVKSIPEHPTLSSPRSSRVVVWAVLDLGVPSAPSVLWGGVGVITVALLVHTFKASPTSAVLTWNCALSSPTLEY